MLTLAHRGYHRDVPENTMAAFEAALAQGVDGIETDLRLTRDGKVVLIHDRIVGGMHPVAELTHEELCACVGYPVPLLDEALSEYPSTFWNLEIKAPEAAPVMLQALRRLPGPDRLLVTSFWHDLMLELSESSDLPCGLLFAHRPLSVLAMLPRADANLPALVCACDTLDEGVIAEAAAFQIETYVYSPVTAADHERIRASGAAGLITDHPELARSGR